VNKEQLIQLFKEKPALLKDVDGDGHSIVGNDYWTNAGWPDDFVKELSEFHQSDFGHPKSTIFDSQGNPIAGMRGIGCLRFHYWLAKTLELPWGEGEGEIGEYFGRGSQASAIASVARSFLKDQGVVYPLES
jgi:hypothetical protein